MAAAPSIGRAAGVEPLPRAAPGADAQALYERHAGRVLSYCQYRLGSRHDAEDAAQTTFLYAVRALQRGVVPELELAWLLKIAENVCRTRRRSAARRAGLEAVRDVHALADVVPAREADSGALAGVADALASLPEAQRRAIVLREWCGCSHREVAEQLGLSEAAAAALILRARRALAKGLADGEHAAKPSRLHALDLASLASALKSAFGGASAAKLGLAVAAVAVGTSITSGPVLDHLRGSSRQATPRVAPAVAEADVSGAAPLALSHERARRPVKEPRAATGRLERRKPAARKAAGGGTTGTSGGGTTGTSGGGSSQEPTSGPEAPPLPGTPLPSVSLPPVDLPADVPTDALPPAPPLPSVPDAPDLPAVPDVGTVTDALP